MRHPVKKAVRIDKWWYVTRDLRNASVVLEKLTVTLNYYGCCKGTAWCGVCHAYWSTGGPCFNHGDRCREFSEHLPTVTE